MSQKLEQPEQKTVKNISKHVKIQKRVGNKIKNADAVVKKQRLYSY